MAKYVVNYKYNPPKQVCFEYIWRFIERFGDEDKGNMTSGACYDDFRNTEEGRDT